MRPDVNLKKVGTGLVVLVTALTLTLLGLIAVMRTAALDLHQQVDIARNQILPESRTLPGRWLSAPLSSGVAPDDLVALDARAAELDHRSDRLLEATAVVALAGMLAGLAIARPTIADERAREATSPLARTNSNGTV